MKQPKKSSFKRREFIQAAALFTAGLATAQAASAKTLARGKNEISNSLLVQTPEAAKSLVSLSDLASTCSVIADRCVRHCEEQIATDQASAFIDCLTAASQMSVVCSAMSKLASMKSVRVLDFIAGCTSACSSCKDACDEHKEHWAHGMHLECKNCSEHCEKMISELGKIKAVLLRVS